MSRTLPSLNALRAFEAAARHCSFAKAAEELCVTPTAVSHQIKSLEDQLGLVLFERLSSGLALTAKAEAYLPPLKRAFDGIARATQDLMASEAADPLVIGVLPNFAMRWLIPHLPDFQTRYSGIEVRLMTARRELNFKEDGVDIAIRAGARIRTDINLSDLQSDLLFATELFPVCSPVLLEDGRKPVHEPADLAAHTLLHCAPSMDDWRSWLACWGCDEINPEKGPRFDSYALTLEAAAHGIGFAMASYPFVSDDLRSGRLVAPFDLTVPQNRAWYLVYPGAALLNRKVELFRNWILAEVTENRARQQAL